ncbi:MAG: DNA polymerase III subunit beta [Thermodesulfovibrionales bacterium]|nr:DNA polymerase III subunit beta [Thermodesulfovibrionales bacterium]
MKLSVSKEELQEKLSNIQNIVEKRNTMPVLSHFLLDAGEKKAYIVATDLETAIKEPLQVKVEKEGKLCIPARKMFEIVKEVEGDITIESEDGQWLKVNAGHSKFRLACLSADEFPAWPGMENVEEMQIDTKTLVEMIEKSLYAAGESDTRYTLNGLLFHAKKGSSEMTVVGTDGHRLSSITRKINTPLTEEKKVIVPRKAAAEVRRFLDRDTESLTVVIGKSHVMFKIDEVQFLTRLIEGTYPNYEQVIPLGNEKKVIIDKDEFIKALRRVSVMSREKSNAIKADLADGAIALSASNPDLGEAKDEVRVAYKGEALSLGFNARYLIDALNAMSGEKIVFELQDPLSPTLLKEEKDDSYKCVIMPMRV